MMLAPHLTPRVDCLKPERVEARTTGFTIWQMKIFCTTVVLLALAVTALADFPFKKKQQEFTTHKPNEVADTLRRGTAVQRNDLALELGIFAPNPSSQTAKSNSPCVNFHHVEERPVTLRAGAENVILLADSSECDSVYVVAFDKAPKSEWRHVRTVRLPSRARRPEVTFAEVVQPGVSEILVHHENTLDSGGAQQEDFVVLKMLGERLEVVLDTTEHSEITLANRTPTEDDNLQQAQTSTFSLLKSAPNSMAANRILEKEVLTDNKTTITRSRVWTWSPELERFRPAPFDAGDVRPAPPPAKKPPVKAPGAAQPPGEKPTPKSSSPEPK
jgi:hypothetical protein